MSRIVVISSLALLPAWAACSGGSNGPCRDDADCPDDDRFCTGPPRCEARLEDGARLCVPGPPPCIPGTWCDEAARRCRSCDGAPPGHPDCLGGDGGPPGASCAAAPAGNVCDAPADCAGDPCRAPLPGRGFFTLTPDGEDRGRNVEGIGFPEAACGAACEPGAENDSCGPCAACVGEALFGNVRISLRRLGSDDRGVCRPRCTVSDTDTGCDRPGYACDPVTLTCLEACVDDRQCQAVRRDRDGDGFPESVIDRGESFPAYCDETTGRCRTRGRPGARIGDACSDDDECPDDGTCLFFPASPEAGICGRVGCEPGARPCPEGTICDVRNVDGGDRSVCLPRCTVGREDGTPDRLGSSAGHPECGAGRACVWAGGPERAEAGSCLPGQYNDRVTANLGERCDVPEDCWSPFGYGACISRGPGWDDDTGRCSVRHCAVFLDADGEETDGLLPGVSVDPPICDSALGFSCVVLGGRGPDTACLRRCDGAGDCPGDDACIELTAGRRYCWPTCLFDEDCRGSEQCLDAFRSPCLESGFQCRCL